MTQQSVRRILAGIFVAAAAVRVVAWRTSVGAIHPDEIFQVIEPAWWRLHGVGQVAWEWNEGVRSWVLPSYNGALLALLTSLGVTRGATAGGFLQLHWAALNLVLVAAGFRGGCHITRRLHRPPGNPPDNQELAPADAPARAPAATPGWQGGLLAAALCGLFPLLAQYAPHTLSELPSMLALVCGLTLAADMIERPEPQPGRAVMVGFLLALGICVRIANAPLVLVAPIWLLLRRRFALLAQLIAGATLPVLIFGLVDLLTWGKFLGSYIGYLKFNFIEGRAAQFGTEPWFWYAQRVFDRTPWSLACLLVPLLLGLRATWPFAASAFGLVALLSTQAHKEERFVIAFWPYLLIGAAGVVGAWWAAASEPAAPALTPPRRLGRKVLAGVGLAGLGLVLIDNGRHPVAGDHTVARARMDAQAVAGADPQITGLLVDSIFWSGGSLWLGGNWPQMNLDPVLLGNRLFSHVVADRQSLNAQRAIQAGFVEIFSRDGVVLLRRQ